jgi:DegV family protein with EDD domain
MLRVFVDSGSSIKQSEKEKYNVEIIPLKILLNDKEYFDGVDLSMDVFYDELINNNQFPKTSLPALKEVEENVMKYVALGDDVIILTISSGISGTYNAMNLLFADEPKVKVIDSETAVGGMKILVHEINKYREQSIDFVVDKVMKLIPRIRVYAVPETLAYLHRGGRLSKLGFAAGTLLRIKPVIELRKTVTVAEKTLGLKKAMVEIVAKLKSCYTNFPIVPSYTYQTGNLEELIARTDEKYHAAMIEYDNLDPAIAAHWGPNACGYIFVEKE